MTPHRIKTIGQLESGASAIVRELNEGAGPVIVTVDDEARAVLQDIKDYDRNQRALAILRLAAYGRTEAAEGAVLRPEEAFKELDAAVYGDEQDVSAA